MNIAMYKAFLYFSIICSLAIVLAACGGGDSAEPGTESLFVNAGIDTRVSEQTLVELSGEAQGPSANITYSWTVAPLIAINHPDTSSASASFTAPTLSESRQYTFTLRSLNRVHMWNK